jgi:ABC-type polysaccharide/polyol phosphate transport system ATPase subunit
MADRDVARGEIRAAGLGRRFSVPVEQPRGLKDQLLFRRPKRELWALRSLDLHVAPSESLGVIGRNGSGKSTLLKLMARIFSPSEGTLEVGGRVGPLLDVGAGFHPEFTGLENVYLSAAIHGLSRAYVDEHLDEIFAFAELERFANVPVRTYSSGMYLRLGFSVAVHVRPDILLVDEVFAVGDEGFQHKCLAKIDEYQESGGTIVFVSHDLVSVERLCDRVLLLDSGRVVDVGPTERVLRAYHRLMADLGTPFLPGCRIVGVRALDADGDRRETFTAGDGAVLEIDLEPEGDQDGLYVTLSIREPNGRAVGSQTATGVSLPDGETSTLRLHLPSLPLREGYFRVDVAVADAAGEILAKRADALELSIASDDPTAHGPITLGGEWELPGARSPVRR